MMNEKTFKALNLNLKKEDLIAEVNLLRSNMVPGWFGDIYYFLKKNKGTYEISVKRENIPEEGEINFFMDSTTQHNAATSVEHAIPYAGKLAWVLRFPEWSGSFQDFCNNIK